MLKCYASNTFFKKLGRGNKRLEMLCAKKKRKKKKHPVKDLTSNLVKVEIKH